MSQRREERPFPATAAELADHDARLARARAAFEAGATCAGCKQAIDPGICGCGSAKLQHHGAHEDGHTFVPMGCDCYRAVPA